MQDKDKQSIIKAIGDLGRRVTPADVATKTGLPVLVVQQKLNQVAAETRGNMQVGKAGDIVYSFAPGFTNAYLTKGIAAVLTLIWAQMSGILMYMLRISFGVALITSLVLVIIFIVIFTIIMSRGLSSDNDRDDGFNFSLPTSGFHFSFWDWMILRDLFLWDSMTRRGPVYYDYRKPTVRQRSKSSFLLNCFSFLFGDGDPNEGLDEKRWQLIAQVIKKNGNVVTAEQLAPYTGANPSDENAVLPVLVRFNGKPEVTATGNIVYVFESMQSTAADQSLSPPEYLKEFPVRFTSVPEGELLPVFIVAGLNAVGAWTVWSWAIRMSAFNHGLIYAVIVTLCVYGTLFVTIPIVRTIVNSIKNRRIEERNDHRFRHAQLISRPPEQLLTKLGEAENYRKSTKITDKDVVYTTEKDALDQEDELSEKFTAKEKEFDASP